MVRREGFAHEALLYAGGDEFVSGTTTFVQEGLAVGEPVMVAVIEPRAGLLRDALGADAERVRFVDMATMGRNPARIIPAWQEWVGAHAPAGRRFRGVGEPIWAGRRMAELVECRQHEALLNVAFDHGPAWSLLCPYDVSALQDEVVEWAHQTHPTLAGRAGRFRSGSYPGARPAPEAMFGDPLPGPPAERHEIEFTVADLSRIRAAVGGYAAAAGLDADGVDRLTLAADELAGNSVRHGGGSGTLSLWRERDAVVCEVHDRGLIGDPLVGRRRPTRGHPGGAGLWMTNQLCDLVQIRSDPAAGTTVRVRVGRG
jgi:anti-sigma regulatory factor (Ser/Thr protein kinase)